MEFSKWATLPEGELLPTERSMSGEVVPMPTLPVASVRSVAEAGAEDEVADVELVAAGLGEAGANAVADEDVVGAGRDAAAGRVLGAEDEVVVAGRDIVAGLVAEEGVVVGAGLEVVAGVVADVRAALVVVRATTVAARTPTYAVLVAEVLLNAAL